MDSTLRSNVSVGLPLDMLVYEDGSLAVTRFVTIDENNQYFQLLRNTWGQQLKSVFEGIAPPVWDAVPGAAGDVPSSANLHSRPVRMAPPPGLVAAETAAPLQSLAQQPVPPVQR
jgi:putative proteasome-type protease